MLHFSKCVFCVHSIRRVTMYKLQVDGVVTMESSALYEVLAAYCDVRMNRPECRVIVFCFILGKLHTLDMTWKADE